MGGKPPVTERQERNDQRSQNAARNDHQTRPDRLAAAARSQTST